MRFKVGFGKGIISEVGLGEGEGGRGEGGLGN
jgi:hypothetical protein